MLLYGLHNTPSPSVRRAVGVSLCDFRLNWEGRRGILIGPSFSRACDIPNRYRKVRAKGRVTGEFIPSGPHPQSLENITSSRKKWLQPTKFHLLKRSRRRENWRFSTKKARRSSSLRSMPKSRLWSSSYDISCAEIAWFSSVGTWTLTILGIYFRVIKQG